MTIAFAIQIIILTGLVLIGLLVFYLKDLLHAAIAFAAFSFLMSVEFYILQAPDVAIAEAGIGAGITTAILIQAVRSTTRKEFDN
ncbi:DUF4040 domain-containing protein [bacterium]|nr:DUF4040 domain-containing protein [bacterium]